VFLNYNKFNEMTIKIYDNIIAKQLRYSGEAVRPAERLCKGYEAAKPTRWPRLCRDVVHGAAATLACDEVVAPPLSYPYVHQFGIQKMIYFYSFFSLILMFFLNPQQTKYFGGLAIEFKNIGLFIKYKTSENFVYFISWIFMLFFFHMSFLLA
jgi:hypothetical protein